MNAMTAPPDPDVELIRRHGGPLSHGVLNPSHSRFRVAGIDGLVGFSVTHQCAVALGDPVCPPGQLAPLADAFTAHCDGQHWAILYTAATARLQAHTHAQGFGSIEFADFLFGDPQHDPETGHEGRHMRQNLNHTRRLGVTTREYYGQTAPDALLEAEAEAICERWRASRCGPQMYLGIPRLFTDRPGRRWFVAESEGHIVGVLSLLQMGCFDCRHLINIVFSTPNAPIHTSELLVVTALRALREEGAHSVCLGIGPRATLGRIDGFGSASVLLARQVYRLAAKLGHLHGKAVFWEKFGLTRTEPSFLLFQPPHVRLRQILALLGTFHFSLA